MHRLNLALCDLFGELLDLHIDDQNITAQADQLLDGSVERHLAWQQFVGKRHKLMFAAKRRHGCFGVSHADLQRLDTFRQPVAHPLHILALPLSGRTQIFLHQRVDGFCGKGQIGGGVGDVDHIAVTRPFGRQTFHKTPALCFEASDNLEVIGQSHCLRCRRIDPKHALKALAQ